MVLDLTPIWTFLLALAVLLVRRVRRLLASLFADISTEMLYPVLPVFLTQTLPATGSVVGLVDGASRSFA